MNDRAEHDIERPKQAPPEAKPFLFREFSEKTRQMHDMLESRARESGPREGVGPAVRFDDARYDGCMVGAQGKIFEAGTKYRDVEGVHPQDGHHERTNVKVLYVNGVITDVYQQERSMQRLANETGASVVGLHNGTSGWFCDLTQYVDDKAGFGKNKAVDGISQAIVESAKSGEALNIVAHSHGALETSRAMRQAARQLHTEGYSDEQIKKSFHDNVSVTTVGGAAETFPEGPVVHHVINMSDFVPMTVGKGVDLLAPVAEQLNPVAGQESKDAETRQLLMKSLNVRAFDMNRGSSAKNHDFDDLYVKHLDATWFKAGHHEGLGGGESR